jgi:GT2 family glycosyltransferase
MLDLTIVIVNHNHGIQVRRTIESLYALQDQIKFQLILVDNASSDGVADWLATKYPYTCLLRNNHPQGFAHNVNVGLCKAPESRFVMLMNPDIECLPGVLEELVTFMDFHPDVGISGPKLVNPDMTVQSSCRGFSTPTVLLIRGLHLDALFCDIRPVRNYLMSDFDHDSIVDVDWVTGALMIIRREAIVQIGKMDEGRYFMYSEDQDWCCRMWHAGWRVCYVPMARAIHVHMREGMKKPWSKTARYQIVSTIRMFQKFGLRLTRTTLS